MVWRCRQVPPREGPEKSNEGGEGISDFRVAASSLTCVMVLADFSATRNQSQLRLKVLPKGDYGRNKGF